MSNSVYTFVERSRKAEEIRKEKIESKIKELEISVKSCNARAISQAFLLGESKTDFEEAKRIAMLIAQFEVDCGCLIKPLIKIYR